MSETRKLAVILVADVVGYSRLAGADEDRLVARLRALRSDLAASSIATSSRPTRRPASERRERQVVEDGQIPRRNQI
jgi:hypothetical protein